jgi:hypothetical protein
MDSHQTTEAKDTWTFIWGSEIFSSSKIYKQLRGLSNTHAAYNWLWKSACQNKHRVFFWLVLKFILNTRGVLRRRNMNLECYECVLCNQQTEESIEHLFIGCPFAVQAWHSINLDVNSDLLPLQNLELLRIQINESFFMEVIILLCWAIWMCRNNFIFRQIPPSTQNCKFIFKTEFNLLLCRARRKYFPKIQEWLDNLL